MDFYENVINKEIIFEIIVLRRTLSSMLYTTKFKDIFNFLLKILNWVFNFLCYLCCYTLFKNNDFREKYQYKTIRTFINLIMEC